MTGIDLLKQRRIGVLAGGCSSERDISIQSGKAVFDALRKAGFDAVFIDIRAESASFLEGNDIDVAFIALHGRFGEDGTVQQILSLNRVPYTGSGPEASRAALDKVESKKRFAEKGLKVPGYRVVSGEGEIPYDDIKFPCVVKPRYEGSSIGLSIVSAPEDLSGAMDKAGPQAGGVIIEEYIAGRELTVGILQDEAQPVVEIIPGQGVYDFTAKYEDAGTRYVVPARIDEHVYKKAQEIGSAAHSALGCRGFSRVDMRMDPGGGLFVLEVNTIPGLTRRSLLPMAVAAAGMDFTELCVRILLNARSGVTRPTYERS